MVIIAGGGLSGLSVAFHLHKAGIQYLLLEKSPSPGGAVKSIKMEDYLLEEGPNSILADEFVEDLIGELNLRERVVETKGVSKKRYVLKGARYRQLPGSPVNLLLSGFFSTGTKIKIIKDLFRNPGETNTKSLEEFFVEHFGSEVTEYALNPFISGIYAGDPAKLLVDETFPSLRKYERDYGSILKGITKNVSTRKKTLTFKNGLQELPVHMARHLNIKYNCSVTDITKDGGEWQVKYQNSEGTEVAKCKSLVLAMPAYEIGKCLSGIDKKISESLLQIHYPAMTIVHSVYSREAIRHHMNGFGGLHPKIEKYFSAGSIWTSSIFPDRAPHDKMLITTFVGGSQYEKNAKESTATIKEKVHKELSDLLKINENPIFQHLTRWEKSIPQYDLNIIPVKEINKSLEQENAFICSNFLNGISMPDCLKKGKELAHKIIKMSKKW